MFRTLALTAGFALVALGAAGSLSAQEPVGVSPLKTGLWEYKGRIFGLIPTGRENYCITPEKAWMMYTQPCDKNHVCTYSERKVDANGRAHYVGVWADVDDPRKRASVTADGDFRAESFTLSARGRWTNGLPFTASLQARYISDVCPPEPARKK